MYISDNQTDQYVAFVRIIFGVVLGASLIQFHAYLFPPSYYSPRFWALVIVYFTAVTSWSGWHSSLRKYPYTSSRIGIARALSDALIVAVYAALLYFGSEVFGSLQGYTWGFFFVFALYFVTGAFRRYEYDTTEASNLGFIVRYGAILLIAAVVYTVISAYGYEFPEMVPWGFILLPLLIVVGYRYSREWRGLPWRSFPMRTKGKMALAIDMDGVLAEQVPPVLEKLKAEGSLKVSKSDITDWEYPFQGTTIKAEIERAEREEEFIRQMPPVDWAVEALKILSGRFSIVIATSREPSTDSWTRDWLASHGMPYDRFINTRSTGKILHGVDILVDDYIGNIQGFLRNGQPDRWAVLFAQPWNQDTKMISDLIVSGRVKIANSWQTVLAILGCSSLEAEQIRKDKFLP